MAIRKDFAGQKIGNVYVIGPLHQPGKKKLFWHCRCDCGNEFLSTSYQLSHNNTVACFDCIRKERADVKRTHGMYGTRIYRTWQGMLNRCASSGNYGKYYHHKGITVCDEWKRFESFYEWAMASGYNDTLTIDRIDCSKGYFPENCRWASWKEQNRNKTNSIMVTIDDVTKNLSDWCEMYGISYQLARQRITRGVDPLKALTTPPTKGGVPV